MTQAQFNLEESEIQFLNRFQQYGFRDRDELIRAALKKLRFAIVDLNYSVTGLFAITQAVELIANG